MSLTFTLQGYKVHISPTSGLQSGGSSSLVQHDVVAQFRLVFVISILCRCDDSVVFSGYAVNMGVVKGNNSLSRLVSTEQPGVSFLLTVVGFPPTVERILPKDPGEGGCQSLQTPLPLDPRVPSGLLSPSLPANISRALCLDRY